MGKMNGIRLRSLNCNAKISYLIQVYFSGFYSCRCSVGVSFPRFHLRGRNLETKDIRQGGGVKCNIYYIYKYILYIIVYFTPPVLLLEPKRLPAASRHKEASSRFYLWMPPCSVRFLVSCPCSRNKKRDG